MTERMDPKRSPGKAKKFPDFKFGEVRGMEAALHPGTGITWNSRGAANPPPHQGSLPDPQTGHREVDALSEKITILHEVGKTLKRPHGFPGLGQAAPAKNENREPPMPRTRKPRFEGLGNECHPAGRTPPDEDRKPPADRPAWHRKQAGCVSLGVSPFKVAMENRAAADSIIPGREMAAKILSITRRPLKGQGDPGSVKRMNRDPGRPSG